MSLSYCASQVRAQDPDRFHLALASPTHAQEGLIAIAAFNLELARTASRVSDPNLGQIRLQWWQEAIDEIGNGGDVRAHQVVKALAGVRGDLDLNALTDMVVGRALELEPAPFTDFEDFTAYLVKTAGAVQRAQARMMRFEGQGVAALANHLGCAYALVGYARAMASGQVQGLRMPMDWGDDPTNDVADACGRSLMHLERAQELQQELPSPKLARPFMKVCRLVAAWQRRLDPQRLQLGAPKYGRPLPFQALRLAVA